MQTDISILLALGAGLLTFLSPCVFPLYPVFLSYITGLSMHGVNNGEIRKNKKAILHTISFLIGFSVIFIFLGFTSSGGAPYLSSLYFNYGDLIRQIGAILLVVFGLVTMGILQPNFLMKERKVNFTQKPSGYIGTGLIGFAFAIGWTPCTGPILAATLALVGTNPSLGLWYMGAYILGFSIPFFVLAFFTSKLTVLKRYSHYVMKVGGGIMVILGIVLFFDKFTMINSLIQPFFGDFQGF